MPEERRKPRFQFSLKKLLIWMAVVSVYCGIGNVIARSVRPQGYALQYLIAFGLLIVLAVVLRAVVPSGAWHMTAAVAGVCSLLFVVVARLVQQPYPGDVRDPIICLMVLSMGSGMGWGAFLFVEANCRFVNWIERKTAKESLVMEISSCSPSGKDDPRVRESIGAGYVDQSIRHGIQICWGALPKERKNIEEVKRQMQRLLDRAIRDLEEDRKEFDME